MESLLLLSKPMAISLWVIQGILALLLLWASGVKLLSSKERLAQMWPWTEQNRGLVKVTGILDGLAGLGLILPGLLGTAPQITFYSAVGLILLMITAIIFHLSRKEVPQIWINLFVLILTIFVAWGRNDV